MRKVLALSFVMIFLMGASAYAQINAKTYSVSPFFGGYTFDGVESQQTSWLSGLRVGYDFTRHLGVEALFEYTRSRYTSSTVIESFPDVYGYRLEGIYHFMPEGRLVPYVAAGVGGRSIRFKDLPSLERNHGAVDYGIGLKYFLYRDMAIRADVRHIFLLNDNLNNLEYNIGISYYFGGPKPVKMEAARVMPAEKPTVTPQPPQPPPAPINLQAKAVSRSQIDLTWNKVSGANVYKVYRAGSYLNPTQDSTLADKEVKASTRYCYNVTALDTDGRESARSNEACATTPAPPPPPPPKVVPVLPAPLNLTAKAVSRSQIDLTWNKVSGANVYKVYRDGSYLDPTQDATMPDKRVKASTRYCYEVTALDNAGRESARSNEACATTPAPPPPPPPPVVMEQKREAPAAPAAVAKVAKEMIEKGRATINVEFDTNKTNIKPKYNDEIKKFADVMKLYPDLKVIIEGHTDTVGGAAFNQKLSQKRAESVKTYMVKTFGIDVTRLSAKGYGMTKPIESNKTAAGRQKNRRVEAAVDYTIKKKK